MKLHLKRVSPDSVLGRTANADFFDAAGILLLKKGQLLTPGIRERLEQREIFVLASEKSADRANLKSRKTFSKDTYIRLVGSLWNIYHEAKLIEDEQINKTMVIIDAILAEIRSIDVYLHSSPVRLGLDKFKEHDFGTFMHVVNVAIFTALAGKHLGYRGKRLKYLTLGAILHDLGKLQIQREILNKPGNLTNHEMQQIRQHPALGVQMLQEARLPPQVLLAVKQHHERWDGKGYPDGLSGNEIHPDAQIVAVTDVYEALTADRPYRKGLPPYHAMEMVIAWSEKDFNPLVVQALRNSLILYPENAIVTLNTGEIGIVAAVPIRTPTRPLVRLLFNRDGRYVNQEQYVDLLQDLTRFILRVEFL